MEKVIDTMTKSSNEQTAADSLHNEQIDTSVIKFKLTRPDAKMPTYAHDGDAGMDVYACDVEYDEENDMYIYSTGVSFESEKGIVCYGFARSSNCYTESYLTNGVGVLDCATFRGSIQYRYKNRTDIATRAEMAATFEFASLPWWKKIFLSKTQKRLMYYNMLLSWEEYYIKNALDFAPYEVGEKVGQLVFSRFITANPVEVDKLSETDRGEGGFGSTNENKSENKSEND